MLTGLNSPVLLHNTTPMAQVLLPLCPAATMGKQFLCVCGAEGTSPMERRPDCQCQAEGSRGWLTLFFLTTEEDRCWEGLSPKQLEEMKLEVVKRKLKDIGE